MPFPFSITGTVGGVKGDMESARKTLTRELIRLRAKPIQESESCIKFSGGMFRLGLSTDLLASVYKGELFIEVAEQNQISVRFKLYFLELLLFVSVTVFGVLGCVVYAAPNLNILEKTSFLSMVWLFIMGVNYLVTMLRFPEWLQKILNSAK
jgi:hypothetical protein